MGYLFILIALFAGTAKGYCGKKTSGYTNSFRDATLANIIRMMLCIVIGFVLIFITGDFKDSLENIRLQKYLYHDENAISSLNTNAKINKVKEV